MGRFLQYIAIGILVSFYFFPIGFSFLPASVNTKMMLAVMGIALFGLKCLRDREVKVSQNLLGVILIAAIFSGISFISTDINQTSDLSYATYFTSLSVWLAAAFAVGATIRSVHGNVTFKLITFYLAAVCAVQCILAIVIDNNVSFQIFVDTYVQQGQEFMTEIDRLYGIGASLDPAGVRFAIVLIMIVALLCKDEAVRQSRMQIFLLLLAFFTITIIGNIISRTTILGVACAGLYFVMASGLFQTIIRYDSVRLGLWFGGMLLGSVAIATFLYQTDSTFHDHMRFAFEGFFNFAETGVWRTDSTDKLNRVMWVWPEDLKTWIIGSGLFANWVYGTDIGYCRFILYCGIVGFSVFAFLFVYLAMLFGRQYPNYWLMFGFLMLLSFLVWIKVATDIFQVYALFFCVDHFIKQPAIREEEYEDRLQHSSYV